MVSSYAHYLTIASDWKLFELNQRQKRLVNLPYSTKDASTAVRSELRIRGYDPDALPLFRHPQWVEDSIQKSLAHWDVVDPLQDQMAALYETEDLPESLEIQGRGE